MKILFLLLLGTTLAYSQPSSAASSESKICYTPSEFAALEAEIQKIIEETALEAADEAVKPHLIYEADLQKKLDTITRQNTIWKYTAIGASTATLFLLILVLLK